MRSFSTFLFAVMALAGVTVATPPACLLAAMGVQSNPNDLKAICGSLEAQVVGNITEKCTGDAYSSATSIYAATCLAMESVTISITSSTKSTSSTASAAAKTTGTDAKTTGTATTATTVAANTVSATSAAATAKSTNSAGSNAPQFFLAALAIGVAGLAL